MNEATARIRINTLLEKAGWRFFPNSHGPANVRLESKRKAGVLNAPVKEEEGNAATG